MSEMQMTPGMQCGMPMSADPASPITEFILCWPGAPMPGAAELGINRIGRINRA